MICQNFEKDFLEHNFQKINSEMVASPDFTLLCLHVETFRVSDSPEVSLTQVALSYVFTWGPSYLFGTLGRLNWCDSGWWRCQHNNNVWLKMHFQNMKIWYWPCIQIGVTTALNMPGTAKDEFFFPVEPKGARGCNAFGYLNDDDLWCSS